jgi:hypothetical protein
VTLNAGGSSDPDGGTLEYRWDFTGPLGTADGTFDRTTSTATTTTSWPSTGIRTVRVEVRDPQGATAVATTTVNVRNQLPIPVLSVTPLAPLIGQTVTLSAAGSSDPDGSVTGYAWDLDGDGSFERNTGATPTTTTSYPNAGAVRVRVRVTDDDGGTGVRFADLTVTSPGGTTPTVPAGPAPTGPAPGGTVAPAGDGDGDGDGGTGGDDGETAAPRAATAFSPRSPARRCSGCAR